MIALEQQLYAAMAGDTTLAGLLGTQNGHPSLYIDQIIENPVYPVARFQRISTVPIYTQNRGGGVGTQASVGYCRFQVDFWTRGANAADVREQIARAFLAVLNGFNAFALPTSPLVLTQAPSYVLNRRHTVEPNTDPPLFKAMFDIKLYWQDQ